MQSNLEEGRMCCTNLFWTLYINTCQINICFLISEVTVQLHLISNMCHMLCRRHSLQIQRDITITHLNHSLINLINKYIYYKSNVLSTCFWLQLVLAPAWDTRIAKSGNNLVHSHPGHSLCLTPWVKAIKSVHGVLSCLMMMYHQTNLDCKSFSISGDVVKMIVALTWKIAKEYFRMMLWLMMMHYHIKFIWSEILSRQTLTAVSNLHCDLDLEYSIATFSQDTPAYEQALSN